jgi:DNA-binding response OmpR family regulator
LDRATTSSNAREQAKLDAMSAAILLVEDDENDALFLRRAMKRAGILNPIQRVCDGREALDYFQGAQRFGNRNEYPLPSLVLLDLKLPHVMGLDVLKWVRDQGQFKSTVVVVRSASQYQNDIANAHRHGADDYLVKPSGLDQLDVIARMIRDSWLCANHRAAVIAERFGSSCAHRGYGVFTP